MNALTASRRSEDVMLNTQFESERIVILGGTSGIGLATAERAAARSAMYDLLSQELPVGRVGEVSDIAEAFLYLMRNGYSSGTIVTVDGGSVLV